MKMIHTIIKEIYQRKWAVLGYCLGAFLFLLLYVSIYPSFQHESAKFNELLKSYPKAILEAFNIEQFNLSTVSGYISAEHFSLIWPLMTIFLGLTLAGQAFAGEIEKGTIAILLSLPIRRIKLFISKYLAGVIVMLIFILLSIPVIIPLTRLFNLSVNNHYVFDVSLLSTLFALAIFSLGTLASTIFSEKSKVYFTTGGLLLIMYIANIMSGLIKSLNDLKYFSYFHYYQPDKAIIHGVLNPSSFWVFGLTIVISFILAGFIFSRRDISV